MTIDSICPHCETRFILQADLLGKSIRCPNTDCREIFEVREAAAVAPTLIDMPMPAPPSAPAGPARVDAPAPAFRSGAVSDFLPVLEVESLGPPPARELPYERIESAPRPTYEPEAIPKATILPPAPPAIPLPANLPAAKLIPDAPIPKATMLPDDGGPRELAWSDDLAEPPVPETSPIDEAILRRRRRRSRSQFALWGLILGTIVLGGGSLAWMLIANRKTEALLASEAKDAYDSANYSAAVTQYEKLAKDFPNSADQGRYLFIAALAKVRAQTSSVSAKETPAPGLKAFQDFVKENGQHPLAKPDGEGLALDIYETGRQAADNLAAHAVMRTKTFASDRTQLKELDEAEKVIAEGRKLLPAVQPFREKDAAPLDAQKTAYDDAEKGIAWERHRLAVFQPYRDLPTNPTDDRIEEFSGVLEREKLAADAEGKEIIAKAKIELRKRIVPVASNVPPVPAPLDGDPTIAVNAPVEQPPAPPGTERRAEGEAEIFFAVARGLLYALNGETGKPLWCHRVAPATADPGRFDLPQRVSLGEGGTDVVIIASEVGGKPGLTSRVALSGEPLWHQPLDAPAAGRPVILRDRIFVPLQDANGTLDEFDLATGHRVGRIVLRQPIGPGATVYPGSGLLYVAAAARRVFVLDVAARDADGRRLPARCVQILATDHPPGGLLCEPVPVGIPGKSGDQRFLVVAQRIDPTSMKLRAFPLPEAGPAVSDAAPASETAIAPVAELIVPGLTVFPPVSDGERVTLVTDTGKLAVFGVNQTGNIDQALYSLPMPDLGANVAANLARGQIVMAEEDAFWAVASGGLVQVRSSLDPTGGWRLEAAGLPRPVGEALHRPQLNAARDAAVIVVRSPRSVGCRALCFDPRDGRIRWQRQLSSVAPAAPVRRTDGSVVSVDEEGGVVLFPATGIDPATRPLPETWVLAPSLAHATGSPCLTYDRDSDTAWSLTPEQPDKVLMARVRSVVAGKLGLDASIALPSVPVGAPLAVPDGFLIPLADGIVYRFTAKSNKLTAGPAWRGPMVDRSSVCLLAPTTKSDEFLTTDGHSRIHRWRWPLNETEAWTTATKEPWEALGRIPLPPIFIKAGERELMIVADPAGLAAYDAKSPGDPMRRWKPGKPTRGMLLTPPVNGQTLLLLAIEGGDVIAIDPTQEAVAWIAKRSADDAGADVTGLALSGNRIFATDLGGRVRVIDAAKGSLQQTLGPSLAGLFPPDEIGAIPMSSGRLLMPLSDGSCVVLLVGE